MCSRRRIFARILFMMIAGTAMAAARAGSASASEPYALYAVPSRVDLLPGDANATRVVIHGAFLRLTTPTTTGVGTYNEPKCGKMYFECAPGDEDLCRLQWGDLRNAATAKAYCAGFGTKNMLSSATLYDEGAALSTPDRWEMTMGVSMASFLDGQCPKAMQLMCSAPAGGAGGAGAGGAAADGGGKGGAGGGGGRTGSGGPGGGGATAGTGGSGSGGASPASGGAAAGSGGDAGTGGRSGMGGNGIAPAGSAKSGAGCSLGGPIDRDSGAAAFFVAMVAGAIARGRRKRDEQG